MRSKTPGNKSKFKENLRKLYQQLKDFLLLLFLLNLLIGLLGQLHFSGDGSAVDASVLVSQVEAEQNEQTNNVVEGEGGVSNTSPSPSPIVREIVATTYNAEVGQTDSDPLTMASGKKVYEGAVASNCYPLKTKIKIDGEKYVVEDRMNKRFTPLCGTENEKVDIFKWDRKDNFKKKVKVQIYDKAEEN